METAPTRNRFSFHTYPNGLRLITVPMATADSVTVLVMVATGSRYETKNINGLSHFLEHMMFKGTTKRPQSTDISLELDQIGSEYNAFTSKEYTGYYVKCAADRVDVALDVISDIYQNSTFAATEIETERGVIIEEINMYLDTPARYVGDLFEELLYGDQPLGWHITGPKAVIKTVTRDDFLQYFHSHYFDKNTVVAVAGKVDPETIKQKVEKYFSNIRANQRLAPVPTIEQQTAPQSHIHYKTTDQTHFILGFRAYNYFADEKEVILNAASMVLSAGFSSRLWHEFREKRGLSYYIRSTNTTYADAGYFEISAGVDNNRVAEAIQVALAECKKLTATPVSPAELKKIKDYAHGKLAIGLETSDDLAAFYADQQLLKGELLTPEEKLAKLDAVTAEQLQQTAQAIFRPERLNLALIGPFQPDDPGINKLISTW